MGPKFGLPVQNGGSVAVMLETISCFVLAGKSILVRSQKSLYGSTSIKLQTRPTTTANRSIFP